MRDHENDHRRLYDPLEGMEAHSRLALRGEEREGAGAVAIGCLTIVALVLVGIAFAYVVIGIWRL